MKEHFNEKPYRKRSITQYSNLNRNSTEKENEKLNHVGYIFLVLTFPPLRHRSATERSFPAGVTSWAAFKTSLSPQETF